LEESVVAVKYSETGLWIEKNEDKYRIGLSEKGQDDIGEVMFVDLPEFSETVSKDEALLSIEGAKSVSEIISPLSGKIVKVHQEIEDTPDLLNSDERAVNWVIELTGVDEDQFNNLNDDAWEGVEEE